MSFFLLVSVGFMIDDVKQIVQQIADEITQIERREGKRNSEAQMHFFPKNTITS